MALQLAHICRANSYPLSPWFKIKRGGVKSTLKPGELGLSCKANQCNDAGTGDLGVLPTHNTLSANAPVWLGPWFIKMNSTSR